MAWLIAVLGTILCGRPASTLANGRAWICTAVGTRTICAVLRDELAGSGDTGPPYSIVEEVLDRYDMDGCKPASSVAGKQQSSFY